MHDLDTRLTEIRERIEDLRARRGLTQPVSIIAVAKKQPVMRIREALQAGLHDIAENRVGELEHKTAELEDAPVRWHYVGRLQRRQTRSVLRHASLIQSVHSHRIAEAISRHAAGEGVIAEILVQVNTSGEERKAGVEGDAALEEVHRICELPNVRVLGLMTMAPLTDDADVIRDAFSGARRLFERAGRIPGFEPRHLSMGMTNDYLIAVEEGSTMLRLGTALFGPRSDD